MKVVTHNVAAECSRPGDHGPDSRHYVVFGRTVCLSMDLMVARVFAGAKPTEAQQAADRFQREEGG